MLDIRIKTVGTGLGASKYLSGVYINVDELEACFILSSVIFFGGTLIFEKKVKFERDPLWASAMQIKIPYKPNLSLLKTGNNISSQ